MTFRALLRKPSACVPFALSGAALALLLGYVSNVGLAPTPDGDEGAPARVFQLIMTVQFVAMAVFATRWLPVSLRPALLIIALQATAAAVPIVTIVALESLV
jgi:hypothetical protein